MWECHPTVGYIFQGSTMVVHGAVNAGVVGSNPTLGAIQGYILEYEYRRWNPLIFTAVGNDCQYMRR